MNVKWSMAQHNKNIKVLVLRAYFKALQRVCDLHFQGNWDLVPANARDFVSWSYVLALCPQEVQSVGSAKRIITCALRHDHLVEAAAT